MTSNNDQLSDEALMSKVKEGNLDDLGTLYERYKVKLYNYFYRLVNDKDQSRDLTQNVFLRIM